jgi:hypothetical protein
MIAVLGELIDAIDTFGSGIANVRYLLSTSYRKQTNARWKEQSFLRFGLDILGGAIGLFFTLLPLGILLDVVL